MSITYLDPQERLKSLNRSIEKSFKSIYDSKNLDEYPIGSLATTICSIAEVINKKQSHPFYTIHKKINRKRFYKIEGLNAIAKKIKISAFVNNDKSITFYLHLRRKHPNDIISGVSKTFASELRIDFMNGKLSQAVIVGQLVGKIMKNEKRYKYRLGLYEREIKYLEKFKDAPGILNLFHTVKYAKVKSGKVYTKTRTFVERFEKDLFVLISGLYRKSSLSTLPKSDTGSPTVENLRMTDDFKAEIFNGCLKALSQMHEQNVIHGDVKPENILIDPQINRIVLCDLMFSKAMKDKKFVETDGVTMLYVSPENHRRMIKKRNLNPSASSKASDMWALGCTLYYFITRRRIPLSSLIRVSVKLNLNMMKLLEELEKGRKARALADVPHMNESTAIAPQESRKTTSGDLERLKILYQFEREVRSNLKSLKEVNLDDLSELRDRETVEKFDQLNELINSLIEGINDELLLKEFLLSRAEIFSSYERMCGSITELNKQLVRIIHQGVEQHDWIIESDSFFMSLIRKMILSEPSKRISADAALKLLRDNFPALR